jgi:aldehyde:ferredoxin oxidoreductase
MWWGMEKYGVRDPESMDRFDEKGKGFDCKLLQDGMSSPDVLATCKFLMYTGVTLDHWAGMIAALTGWDDFDGFELLKACERVNNLARLFNIREGISRKDDFLPKRILSMPEFGDYKDNKDCITHDLEALLDEYYTAREWDLKTGYPTVKKLEELGLADYAGIVS